jgi:tetratricopeptide (TPR) repeat protein/TolB-like protein
MEQRQVLDSWKEISAYLNRSVMTCQRWERQLDLPVHRLDGTPRARVFAYPDELDRWLAEKLHVAEPAEESRHPSSRRRGRWVLIAIGSLSILGALVIAAWRLVIQLPLPAPAQVPTLAILSFENRTGDPAWEAWNLALPDLLTIDLRQSKFLDVIRTSAIFTAAGPAAEAEKFSLEDIKRIAEKAGVSYAVTGSIVKTGEDVVLTAFVYDAVKGDLMGSPRATCRTEKDVFRGVDGLSKGIKTALNVGPREIRGDIDRPVARITTASPQAFRSLSAAYRAQAKGPRGEGKFEDAVAPLLKAVELDPEFGLAYRYLHYSCRALSRADEAKDFGERAIRLGGRIGERERRSFLYDFFMSDRLDKKAAAEELERLRKNYPYDRTMTDLALDRMGQEEWDAAIPILEKLILRYPQTINIVASLVDCYRSVGRYQEAEKLVDERLGTDPKPGRDTNALISSRRRLALVQGKFDVAHDCVERLKAFSPDPDAYFSNKGFVFFLQDDLSNAEKMYQKMVESDNQRTQMSGFRYLAAVSLSRGHIEEAKRRTVRAIELLKGLEDYGPPMEKPFRHFLAYLERLSGRLPEAFREIELAYGAGENKGLVQVVPVIYLRALITVEMNRFEEFEKQIEEIREYLDPDRFPFGAPRYMRVYYDLLGHRELQKKNYDLAIQYFWKALDLLSPLGAQSIDGEHAKYYYDLAEAYRLSGNRRGAVTMSEKVVLPTVSREFSGDLYAKSYYWMGVDSELRMNSTGTPDLAREWREKAVGHYHKFLGLWSDADPIFPEVEDARQRLARLEAK